MFSPTRESSRYSSFHAFADKEIPDFDAAIRVGLRTVRRPAAITRLESDLGDELTLRSLGNGSVPDHGRESVFEGVYEYDFIEWIARLTSPIHEQGTLLVHCYGAISNPHRGIAARRDVFDVEPTTADASAASPEDQTVG